jgi:predicted enzyme related to lactoylglutathione lyase
VSETPFVGISSVTFDAPDVRALAAFYQALLGWPTQHESSTWVKLARPGGGPGLSFQYEPEYVRPVWPADGKGRNMQVHLDIEVTNLAAAGERVVAAGGTLAEFQPQDDVRVYLDPAGHPFCIWSRAELTG